MKFKMILKSPMTQKKKNKKRGMKNNPPFLKNLLDISTNQIWLSPS